MEKWIAKEQTASKGKLGDWIFQDPKKQESPVKDFRVPSLTAGAFQEDWKIPSEFPLCPVNTEIQEPLLSYAQNLQVGKVFCRNKQYESILEDFVITLSFFDKLPPWSLYKVFAGISWLLAMSALVKSGSPVSTSLLALRRDSNPYLRERIDKTLVFINNGDNLGQALEKTGLEFPDREIIADLKVYSELDNFEDAMDKLANEWLEESVYIIEQKASILNMIALLSVGGVIAWAVMGVFDMQDQITSAMG